MKEVEHLMLLNQEFVAGNEYNGPDTSHMFDFIDYKSNVVLTAPHSTRSIVNNKEKVTDVFTGPIVRYLGTKHKISHIVKPNYIKREERISDFVIKNNLESKYILDFHGMSSKNDFNLAIGIGYLEENNYKKELDYIKQIANDLDIIYVINHPNYTGKPGLTGDLQRHYKKSNILQLEWREDFRNFYDNEKIVLTKTIPFMEKLIDFLKNKI